MRELGALRRAVAEAEQHRALLGAQATADDRRAAFDRLRTARRTLDAEVRAVVGQGFAPLLAGLDPEVPLALLPVRLETRLRLAAGGEGTHPPAGDGTTTDTLLVRIFPDDIHVDSHEPLPTDAEVQEGRRYWRTVWRAGRTENADGDRARLLLAAWGQLTGTLGAERARWLVRLLTPTADTRPAAPVPGTDPVPEPDWPAVPVRGRGWNRAATASTLPDQFVVRAYQGDTLVGEEPGKPVPDTVQMGPDPDAVPAAADSPLDPGLRWLTEYQEAEADGLAVTVPLRAALGYDRNREPLLTRVVAFGVSATLTPEASADRLARLLAGHDGDGEAAFVPQGTATNNLPGDERAAPAPPDVDRLLGATPAPDPDPWANSARTAAALGVPAGPLAALPGGQEPEQADARALQIALWSATGDFYLDELLESDQGGTELPVDRGWLRRHYIENVRARGPLPVLRVGRQPYGLLPVTATARWQADEHEPPGLTGLHRVLGVLRPFWEAGVGTLPRVGGPDQPGETLQLAKPERDVLRALGMAPVSRTVSVRAVQGGLLACFKDIGLGLAGLDFTTTGFCMADTPEDMQSRALDEALGITYRPRISHHVNGAATRLWLPYVRPNLPEGQDPVAALTDFLNGVVNRFDTLALVVGNQEARTLLEALLKHTANLEYGRAAAGVKDPEEVRARLRFAQVLFNPERKASTLAESGLKAKPFTLGTIMGLPTPTAAAAGAGTEAAAVPTVFETIQNARTAMADQVFKAVTRNRGVLTPIGTERPWSLRLAEIDAALQYLAGRVKDWDARKDAFGPLERLLGECLDLVSHRLDAWIGSLATARLTALRARRPAGVQLGAYGWVENLSPRSDPLSRGWILAPSPPQAATAAILRSGALSHPTDPGAFAVDLSSRRMRVAMAVLDGISQGQPFGALLGYRLERRLHDEGEAPGSTLVLDRFVAPLRAKWSVQTAQHPGTGAQEFIGAHDVTDGARLADVPDDEVIAYLRAASGTPPMTGPEEQAVRGALEALRDDLDAVGDLLLAESVHQLTQGNPDRAGATLESLAAGGQAPPRPQVLDTPRRGVPVSHRVLVVVPDGTPRATGWDGDRQIARPRASAEPRLDTWAGHQLGTTDRIRLRVAWLRPGQEYAPGAATVTEHAWPLTVHCALDVVALAAGGRLRAVLATALLPQRPSGVPADAVPVPLTDRGAGWSRTTLDILQVEALGAAVAQVLASGRPGTAADLAHTYTAPTPAADPELHARAEQARAGLLTAVTDKDPDALAAFGVTGPPAASPEERADQLAAALREARARLARADEAAAPAGPRADSAVLEAVFGSGFRAVGLVAPPDAARLDASFGTGLERGGDSRLVPGDWVDLMGTVRPGTGALADLLLHTGAAATGGGHTVRIGQTPFAPKDRWVGARRTPEDEDKPATGLVVYGPDRPLATGTAAVLVVDAWSELIPAQRHTAGATFHFDAPGARAPQAVLLAVPPAVGAPWTPDVLAATIGEALDLAKLRLVDLDALGWLGRYLPAAYLPESAMGTEPSVHVKDLMKRTDLADIMKRLIEKES
ncbi:hypothetical protein J7W19_00655 [Streptomyces mobaraensis NBRC 13819 = DSM 40847]|uniref:Uncharacterized protein n=1 Tax=Streptomyces mobaraensis (strain ATCC 29032 / DSM 40847 / JCM 4168 / NBRC 13819 / NCIMB 11159 / IPCR 16-22) TaxID=1223523 RepID=M3BPD3_STRM1|nr:hypothetical protein [Streptomyces mobaraensis]EMF01515.1 hypothetical protein H340_05746 [Streptomyces mobaraensis NBRC 13819 = DSM 40847]QTT72139.1 hypothetical protein J7W19_00655 [Streptomyces mobaraensis NBRC 13819 = DSM 40847]